MTDNEIQIGMICRVKQEVWADYAIRSNHLGAVVPEQPVVRIGTHPPYEGYAMLAYPFWWWKIEDLEVVEDG